jgi:uncharacterized damage-inducible protein DinB
METPRLTRQIESVFGGPAWHGTSVRGALKDITPEEARWQPAAGRPSVWEIVLHLAYTRHRVLGRMRNGGALPSSKKGGVATPARFPRPLRAAWWPALPKVAQATSGANGRDEALANAWNADLALLDDYHDWLMAATRQASASALETKRRGARFTLAEQLIGVAHHDAYHTGQIRLVRLNFAAQRS